MESPESHSDRGRTGFVWVLALATAFLLGMPLAFLLLSSFRGPSEYLPIEEGARWTLDNFAYIYLDRVLYTEILPNTLVFAIGSLGISCCAALVFAWNFERPRSRATVVARMLILAPMAIPTPALAVAWMQLLGPNAGWVNMGLRSLLGSELETGPLNIFSMTGIVWCQGLAGIPVAYLLLAPVVRGIRYDLEEAGYVSGAANGITFRRVSFPMILSVVAGPLLVLFLITLEQVDFPYILGPTAGINVLGTKILWEIASPSGLPNIGAASAAAMLILVLAFLGLAIHDRLLKAMPTDFGTSVRDAMQNTWRSKWLIATTWMILGVYVLVSFAMPIATLIVQSFGAEASNGAQCCYEALMYLAADDRFMKASLNTLLVAVAAAAIGTIIGVGIGLCSVRSSDRMSTILNRVSVSSIAIPSIVAAFGVAVVFISFPVGIYGTVGLLMVAYSYRIAMATRMARSGLAQVGSSLHDAASVSGATWFRIQLNIVLPLIAPSIVASAALLFVIAVREFTIPLMLYSPDNVVLSVLLLQLQQSGHTASAALVGLGMTTLTILGVACLVLADDRLSRRGSLR